MAVILFVTALGAGCSTEDARLAWEFDFASEALRTRAVLVEGTILEGGCTSSLVRYTGLATATEAPPPPPLLGPGRYGFAGRARDGACTWFADGCVDVNVPPTGTDPVVVVFDMATETAACPPAQCTAGVCDTDPSDAGPDAAPDAMVDSSVDSAAEDTAVVDTSIDAPCVGEGTACAGGTCHDGSCCVGCWNGTACEPGGATDACGSAGADCTACDCACAVGACVIPTVGAIGTGALYSCAVTTAGELHCWGDNLKGQLGIGTSGTGNERLSPARVGTGSNWATLTCGDEHTCAIGDDGSLFCWGDNMDGQLGTGDTGNLSTPGQVETDMDWALTRAPATGDHTCMLKADDTLHCMGQNNYGQLGIGTLVDASTPTPVPGTWMTISIGHHHTCGIRMDGTLWCWGENAQGQLGLGTLIDQNTPQQVGTESDWTAVGLGDAHSCAIRGGQLYCWGENGAGQLGDGSTARRLAPALIGSDTDWTAVSGGIAHTCALKSTGRVFCTGSDADGQLGDGTAGGMSTLFMQVVALSGADAISSGEYHSCARAGDASMRCWGGNGMGALGIGSRVLSARPQTVCIGL